MNKKVSVIIPCYNNEKYVEEAIESALNQTYKNIEIVCINDGSTDSSTEKIKPYKKYSNFIFIDNKENKGVIYSRNYAIDIATGEYILPLDADDKIEPTYIEKAVKVLNNNPEIGIVYSKARYFGAKNKEWNLPDFDETGILYRNCIFISALFRKTDFLKAGKFKEYMEFGYEDWDLWLSFLELGLKPYKIDEILFNYRQHFHKSRNNLTKDETNKIYSIVVKNHFNLYFNNKKIIEHFFHSSPEKLTKYRKFNQKLIIIIIIQIFIGMVVWLV